MTKDDLVTVREGVGADEAKRLLHQHRIEKIIVVDGAYRCVGLITVKDIEKAQQHPNAAKDERGRLRVAAATGVGDDGLKRALALIEAECDDVVVDSSHGQLEERARRDHAPSRRRATTPGAGRQRRHRRRRARADRRGRRRGQGRHRAGLDLHHPHRRRRRRAAADRDHGCGRSRAQSGRAGGPDGGIKYSGDLAKAIAAGASVGMVVSLLAGTEEAPGEVFLYQGRSYKGYRGMGSLGAMARGSADRYFQAESSGQSQIRARRRRGPGRLQGPVANVVHQIIGGLRAAMA